SKAFKVIRSNCTSCHNPNNPMGGIEDIENIDYLLYYGLVVRGEPELSPLYTSIQNGSMPLQGRLSAEDTQAIYDWIHSGLTPDQSPVTPPSTPPSQTLEAKFASINNLILKPKCLSCHNSILSEGGVSFSSYQNTMNTVQPGNINASSLYTSVNSGDMPRNSPRLSNAEVSAIRTWIQNGAANN